MTAAALQAERTGRVRRLARKTLGHKIAHDTLAKRTVAPEANTAGTHRHLPLAADFLELVELHARENANLATADIIRAALLVIAAARYRPIPKRWGIAYAASTSIVKHDPLPTVD